jgi:uncharacterized protein YjbJ (UPF0337 family)
LASNVLREGPAPDGVKAGPFSEEKMKNSTRQQVEGKLHETRGSDNEKAGEVTNNPDLESRGRIEKVAGTVQKTLGKIEKAIGK